MTEVIIFGCGDLAKQVYYYLNNSKKYNVVCFTVNEEYISSNELLGKKIIPFEEIEEIYSSDKYKFITAIGYSSMRLREKIYINIIEKGYDFISFIHDSVILNEPYRIGKNNLILSNVIIEPNVVVGDNNVIYSNTVIGHDSVIEDNNIISIANNIAGFCKITNGCFIGIGSTIKDNIYIDSECLIGAGSLILNNTEKLGVYVGTPAKRIKDLDTNKGIMLK